MAQKNDDWNTIVWRPDNSDLDNEAVLDPNSKIWNTDYLQTISDTVAQRSDELRKLSLDVHANPELGYEEYKTHDILVAFMKNEKGWKVTPNHQLPTAWLAEWQSPEAKDDTRTIGICSEMDALPNIGHACGHNLIAISGIAIAFAIKAVFEKYHLPGKIQLLGTPAEEGGHGKVKQLDFGAFKNMAAALMSHPTPGPRDTVSLTSSLAIHKIVAEFTGHTAHAALSPWEGKNAQDAAVLAYTNISALRQQLHPTWRVQGMIQGKDWALNVIPDNSTYTVSIRVPTVVELDAAIKKIVPCLEAAALATGCTVKLTHGVRANDIRQNIGLGHDVERTFRAKYGRVEREAWGVKSASTDFGNVTYALPALHPGYSIPTVPEGGNHTARFTEAVATEVSHRATLDVAEALALTGVRVVLDTEWYEKEVWASFERDKIKREQGIIGIA